MSPAPRPVADPLVTEEARARPPDPATGQGGVAATPGPPAGAAFATTRVEEVNDARARARGLEAAAFDVCHPALALRALLLVQVVLAVAALAQATSGTDWLMRQAAYAFAGVSGTGLWLLGVCAAQRALRRLEATPRAALALGAGAVAALVGWAPLAAIGVVGEAGVLRVAGVAVTGLGLAALLWTWLEWRAQIWQPRNSEARLAELQSRIRPHFLFNALNSALALVREDPERAERVLEDLSELFRAALAEVGAAVPLADEIALAQRYLDIEQVRFGDRLRVHWEIDPRAAAVRVPPLVLQPLVENAVRHGVEPATGVGEIRIRAAVARGQATVTVSNTLPAEPGPGGHGMALANVRERLSLLHDLAAECKVWREGPMFHARLVLPLP